jgi:hypothetical protein
MDKIFSPIKERVVKFVDNQGLSKEVFFKEVGISASNFKGSGAKSELGGDKIVNILTTFPDLNPTWLLMGKGSMLVDEKDNRSVVNEPMTDYISGKNLKVREVVVPTDSEGRAKILFVPALAFASYMRGYSDPEYVVSLPTMTISGILGEGHFRGFGIEGDSMDPTYCAGDVVICREVPDWNWIRTNQCYVIVSIMGIVLKRCLNKLNTEGVVHCLSDNDYYEGYDLKANEILEVWEVRASMTIGAKVPHPIIALQKRMNALENRLGNSNMT